MLLLRGGVEAASNREHQTPAGRQAPEVHPAGALGEARCARVHQDALQVVQRVRVDLCRSGVCRLYSEPFGHLEVRSEIVYIK